MEIHVNRREEMFTKYKNVQETDASRVKLGHSMTCVCVSSSRIKWTVCTECTPVDRLLFLWWYALRLSSSKFLEFPMLYCSSTRIVTLGSAALSPEKLPGLCCGSRQSSDNGNLSQTCFVFPMRHTGNSFMITNPLGSDCFAKVSCGLSSFKNFSFYQFYSSEFTLSINV